MIGKYCMVRSTDAGVFAGTLQERTGDEVVMTNARRIWYWDGAATLSQLAQSGTSKPKECKFPEPVDEILVLGVIEIIPITPIAKTTLDAVPIWKE
jgi:hypothetical protein